MLKLFKRLHHQPRHYHRHHGVQPKRVMLNITSVIQDLFQYGKAFLRRHASRPSSKTKWHKNRRLAFYVSLAILFVLGPIIYLGLTQPWQTKAAPWASTATDWQKRKQVTLTNNSGQTLIANTTYTITVNTKELVDAGHLQADCSDLRVYYQPNDQINSKLAYYFDTAAGATNCADSEATKVYFPLQANLSNNSSAIEYYLYYDSPGATSEASVDAFDIGEKEALLVCPFNGDTECVNGDGAESPTTESGAIRYSGGKSALSFDGTTSDKVTGVNIGNIWTDSFTGEAWINTSRTCDTGDYFYMDIINNSDDSVFNVYCSNGTYRLWFWQTLSPTSVDYRAIVNLTPNTWHHIAYVFNPSTKSVRLYFDGVEPSSYSSQVQGNGTLASSFTYKLGERSNSYFQGLIDEVRISNTARYTSNFTPQTTPFVRDEYTKLLLHFDENGDDPRNTGKAIDDSGNGNHGTITGAKYVAGLVGVDASTSDSGNVPSQSYADHSGVFIEEGTTNLVTNPSFENGTYDAGWSYAGPREINTATISTSSSADATSNSTQRKTWYDGTYYWQAFNANSRIEFWYSSDGSNWTENTSARVDVDTNDFSISADSSNAFINYVSSDSIMARKASSYPSTSFSWNSENSVLDGGPTTDISYGTPSAFNSGQVQYSSITALSSTTFVAAYQNPSSDGAAVVGTVSGTTISYGSEYVFDTSASYDISVGALSSTSFAIAYYLSGPNSGKTVIGTVSGTTISYGSTYTFNAGSTSTATSMSVLSSTKIVIAYSDYNNSEYGTAIIGTVSGTTISFGAEYVFNTAITRLNSVSTISSTEFIVGYNDIPTTYTPTATAIIGTVSGTTISFGAEYTYGSPGLLFGWGYDISVSVLSNSSFVFGYVAGKPYAVAGTISGTTITFGSADLLYDSSSISVSISRLTDTSFVAAYQAGAAGIMYAKIGTVSGTSISWGSNYAYDNVSYTYNHLEVTSLTSQTFVVVYPDKDNSDRGTCVFGTVPVNIYQNSQLTMDSNGKLWTMAIKSSGSDYLIETSQSTNTNDITSWESISTLNTSTNSNKFSTIMPLNLGSMYSIWIDGTTIEGKKYNGSAWDGSPTSIATGSSGASTNISATSDSSGNIHLVYINSSGQVMYQEYTTSWQTAVTLDSNSGNEYPTISLNSSTGQLSVFWIRSDDIFYKLGETPYTSGYWDASATIFESTGTNAYLTSGYSTYGTGGPFLSWTEGTSSPYNVNWGSISFGRLTVTENTTAPYYKFGSKSAKIVASGTGANDFTTTIDPNSTANHTLSAYVYNGTSGAVGGTVDNTVAQLVWEGTAQSGTTYTDMGGGWWRLSYSATTTNSAGDYGVQAFSGKTIYVDGVQLEEKSDNSSAGGYATTYVDGSLGSGYSWSGTANESTSLRSSPGLKYSTTSNIQATSGSVAFWVRIKRNTTGIGPPDYRNDYFVKIGDSYIYNGWNRATSFWLGSNNIYSASYPFTENQWAYVVATWDSGANEMKVYKNGVLATSGTYSAPTFGNDIDFNIINYGGHNLSNFSTYASALIASEVASLYYSGLGSHEMQSDFTEQFSGQEEPTIYWKFDEGFGEITYDSSQTGNNGVIDGTTWSDDTFGSATEGKSLQFDGVDDHVYKAYANDIELDPVKLPFSTSVWFKAPSSVTTQQTLIARYAGSGYKVYMNASGQMCFGIDDDSTWGPDDAACSTQSFADSNWHLATAIKGESSISLYVDAVQVATTTITATGGLSGSSPTFYVGIDSDGTSNPWKGFLDEVRTYSYAMSTEQILTEFSARGSVKGVSSSFTGEGAEGALGQGLVGYWKMDEASWNGTAGEVIDASGNNNHGVRSGDATTATGKFGKGGTFDGTGDYVPIGQSSSLGVTDEFTFSAWVKTSDSANTLPLISKGNLSIAGTTNKFAFGLYQGRVWAVYRAITGTTISTNTVSDNAWHHITWTFSKKMNKTFVYIDGKIDGEGYVSPTTTGQDSSDVKLGTANNSGYDYYHNGGVDELRVYNRALSPAEVQALYNWAPKPRAQLKMDEGGGSTANDSSGNNRPGTLNNNATWEIGKFGQGIKLDGTGDSISVPSF